MLVPSQFSRQQSSPKREGGRRLQVETLEHRRLLSSDGILPDLQELIAAGGFVSGTKWEDLNANGERDANEPGLAGVTIYADTNNNGALDQWEPSTITSRDNPNTRFDEAGRYELFVATGNHTIREVQPKGFVQTFPGLIPHPVDGPEIDEPFIDEFATVEPSQLEIEGEPGEVILAEVAITIHPTCIRPYEFDVIALSPDGGFEHPGVDVVNRSGIQINGCNSETSLFEIEIMVHGPELNDFELGFFDVFGGDVVATIPVSIDGVPKVGGHEVEISHGDRIDGLDFGNARIRPANATIEGRKWLDRNGNGTQDVGEPGLGGVQIYLDANNNGEFDRGEKRAYTWFEDPFTDFDEGGVYSFGGLRPGTYTVREVVPGGYAQTYPTIAADIVSSETGSFAQVFALDFDVTGVEFSQSGETTKTSVELTVQSPDTCGQVLIETHTVIGNTILVDVQLEQSDALCALPIITTQTVDVSISGLEAGDYTVVGTLRENGSATLGVVGEIEIGRIGAHTIEVAAGEIVSGLDFGNRRTGPAESIQGVKWNDINGDAIRQRDEPGLGGVTIYLDANSNGVFDDGELSTVTSSEPDRVGAYSLDVLPGLHEIREIVPEGYQQTFPLWFFENEDVPLDELVDPFFPFPGVGSHFVEVYPGNRLEGIDFGNQSTLPAAVSGTKWNDTNGDGIRSDDEAGLAGVTIYVDTNFNARFDRGEPSAVSDDSGGYVIKAVRPGTYFVREVVPQGYRQTFPYGDIWFLEGDLEETRPAFDPDFFPPQQDHYITFLPGDAIEGIDFGNQRIKSGSISGLKWQDDNGNRIRDPEEVGLAGVTIYIDTNRNGLLDANEVSTLTSKDDAATVDDETGRYSFTDLKPFKYYTIREIVPEGHEQTFPAPLHWIELPVDPDPEEPVDPGLPEDEAGQIIFPFPIDYHNVYVDSGQDVEQIHFGNREIPDPGFVSGMKWEDIDGNGKRDDGEPGLPGVAIFADANLNGRLDLSESSTITQKDNPDTEVNEAGQYTLKVRPGFQVILEQLQRGFEQTYPDPSRELIFPYNRGHAVTVESDQTLEGLDFGNRRRIDPGVISGVTWFDFNANGVQDRGEGPISGVTVFLDQNDNGQLDEKEASTVSGRFPFSVDNAVAPFPRNGFYSFDVKPGDYTVRQVVPPGSIQTYPIGDFELGESTSTRVGSGIAEGFDLVDVYTTSTSPNDSGQTDTLLTFESTWAANHVEVEVIGVVVADNEITVELTAFPIDVDADVRSEQLTTVNVGPLAFGDYKIRSLLFEEPSPDGIDVPFAGLSWELEAKFIFEGDNAHRVSVESGDYLSGLDFGSIAVPIVAVPDSQLGEDPHAGAHDDTATEVKFQDGHLLLNSYVDADDDLDVFRFIGNGQVITGEGGRMDGSEDISYELLDGAGQLLASATAGEPLSASTLEGETYYLRVSGAQGQYQLDLFEEPNDAPETAQIPGDTDSDGDVDFTDFLMLSARFGQEVDAAFAEADFDGDDEVTFADFLLLSANFGRTS